MWISAFIRSNIIVMQQNAVESVFQRVENDAMSRRKNSKNETITYPVQK